jgi:hypothetical protein
MELSAWISAASVAFLAIGIFAGRNLIKASIERSVQHKFDEKIEGVRTEFHKNEEQFKSYLRSKEIEISALRDGVLSGRMQRQALLDKRRIDAVERVWAAVIALAPYKFVSMSMAMINFDAAAKEAPRNANLRKFFQTIGNCAPLPTGGVAAGATNFANTERPFVSPLAWAYFSAYQTIVLISYTQAKILELGIEEADKFLKKDHLRNLLKTTLPHQADFIDAHDFTAYYYLLDELESSLLAELGKMLEGKDADQASLVQSAEIMKMVKKASTESAEQLAKAEKVQAAEPR